MAARRKPAALDYEALHTAQAAHEAAGGSTYNGPLYQAIGSKMLDELAASFENGDAWALIHAVNTCAQYEIPMPDWVAKAWLRRSRDVLHYKVASWDEVLPRAKPIGRKLAALRLAHDWTLAVVQAVHDAAGPQVPPAQRAAIDEQLFDILSKRERWPFGGSKAKDLYYAARNDPHAPGHFYLENIAAMAPKARGKPMTSTIRRKS